MKYKTLIAAFVSGLLFLPAVNFAAKKGSSEHNESTKTEKVTSEHHERANKSELTSSVDINQADAKTIATLKDIGAKKAEAIVAYRTKNGAFKSVDDLLQVKGMSQRILDNNKDRITLG